MPNRICDICGPVCTCRKRRTRAFYLGFNVLLVWGWMSLQRRSYALLTVSIAIIFVEALGIWRDAEW